MAYNPNKSTYNLTYTTTSHDTYSPKPLEALKDPFKEP